MFNFFSVSFRWPRSTSVWQRWSWRSEGTPWCSRYTRRSWASRSCRSERLLWVVTVRPAHGGVAGFCEGLQHEGPQWDVKRGLSGKLRDWTRNQNRRFVHLGFLSLGLYVCLFFWYSHLESNFVLLKPSLWLLTDMKVDTEQHTSPFETPLHKKFHFTSILPSLYCKIWEIKNSLNMYKPTSPISIKQQRDKSESFSVCLCKCVNTQIILLDDVHAVCEYLCCLST